MAELAREPPGQRSSNQILRWMQCTLGQQTSKLALHNRPVSGCMRDTPGICIARIPAAVHRRYTSARATAEVAWSALQREVDFHCLTCTLVHPCAEIQLFMQAHTS